MAGDGPPLSAFAARKRLLARTSESRSSSTTEDESKANAGPGAAPEARGSGDAAAGDGTPRSKRAAGRRKRQRVETATAEGQEKKVTVKSETTSRSKETRQSTARREVGEEQRRTPVQPPIITIPTMGMDVDEKARNSNQFAQLKALGAVMDTPAR